MFDDVAWIAVLAILATSFSACSTVLITQRWHGALTLDHDLTGAQKIHQRPVPRIGGVGLLAGLMAGIIWCYFRGGDTGIWVAKMLGCALPTFAAGLIEDLTKRVSVRMRLLASFLSAGLAAWLLDATLLRLNTPLLDDIMAWAPAAALFTCFAVGGMTNAVNIIDGLNGLASGAVALMLGGLAAIAWQLGDSLVLQLCLWGMAAVVGFMLLNYPFGRIFLGDGGAYLAGFWLAECAVMLLHRNPGVSTWSVLLVVFYPFWETMYSMYRRRFKQRTASGQPDMAHLHHLVYKWVGRTHGHPCPTWMAHGFASALLWGFIAISQIAALMTVADSMAAILMNACLATVYVWLHEAMSSRWPSDAIRSFNSEGSRAA